MAPSSSLKQVVPTAPKRATLADSERLNVRRLSTGIASLDRVFGRNWETRESGLAVPSFVLFAGPAGSGKSTLVMRLCASTRARGVLYLSSEQTLPEIRDNAERCGLSEDDMKRIDARWVGSLEDAFDAMHELDPQLVILDSFQETRSSSEGRDAAANDIDRATKLKNEMEKHKRTIIAICHLNKQEQLAGVQRIQHICSVVMRLKRLPDPEHADYRMVHCPDKNRFGSTSEKAFFRLTERGMVDAIEPAPVEPEEADARPSGRRRGGAGARHAARERGD